MVLPLSYGEAPESGRNLGELAPPRFIENSRDSGMGGNDDIYNAYGLPLPDRSRVRWVLQKLEKEPKPFQVSLKGMGTLIVGDKGWKVV